jgi:hypothetical protein
MFGPTGERACKEELCKLRLISRYVNAVVSSELFRTLYLDFKSQTDIGYNKVIQRNVEIVNALASRSTTVFQHTTRLSFCPQILYWLSDTKAEGVAQAKQLLVDKIFDAISALTNLRLIE